MSNASRKTEKLLKEARLAINNAKELDVIKAKITEYGFDENMLKKGEEILLKTDKIYETQRELRGSQKEWYVKMQAQMKKVMKRYHTFRKLARKELRGKRNEGIRKTLGIDGKARFTLDGVQHESSLFYEALLGNEEILQQVEHLGLTKESIQEKIAEVEELKKLNESHQEKVGEAQHATKERDDLNQGLEAWMFQFKTVCKDVFADDPQQMEKLGIKAFSEGYKRSKAAKNAAGKKETTGETVSPAAEETASPAAEGTAIPAAEGTASTGEEIK